MPSSARFVGRNSGTWWPSFFWTHGYQLQLSAAAEREPASTPRQLGKITSSGPQPARKTVEEKAALTTKFFELVFVCLLFHFAQLWLGVHLSLVYPCSYCLYFSSDWAPRVSISYKIAFVAGISDEYKMKFKGGRLARKSLSSQKRVRPQLYHPTMVNFCLEELHLRRILFFLVQKQSSYPPLWKCYPKCC